MPLLSYWKAGARGQCAPRIGCEELTDYNGKGCWRLEIVSTRCDSGSPLLLFGSYSLDKLLNFWPATDDKPLFSIIAAIHNYNNNVLSINCDGVAACCSSTSHLHSHRRMPYHLGRETWHGYDTKTAWFWQARRALHCVNTRLVITQPFIAPVDANHACRC